MVSSENPLSTTTRYYQNQYDSTRQTPSVANNQRNYGEQRTNYLRTGVVSQNNPLANIADSQTYYNNYHGKVCDEIESKPKIKEPKFKQYQLQRITSKCVSRGERGLFGLKRLFQTFDSDNSGTLEYKEFKRAV